MKDVYEMYEDYLERFEREEDDEERPLSFEEFEDNYYSRYADNYDE